MLKMWFGNGKIMIGGKQKNTVDVQGWQGDFLSSGKLVSICTMQNTIYCPAYKDYKSHKAWRLENKQKPLVKSRFYVKTD